MRRIGTEATNVLTRQLMAIALMSGLLVLDAGAQQAPTPSAANPIAKMDIDQLATRLRALGAGDRSVIVHSASDPASNIMTTTHGSPNDVLWSEMEAVGWTTRADPFAGTPQAEAMAKIIRGFKLTEAGAAAVKTALAKAQSR